MLKPICPIPKAYTNIIAPKTLIQLENMIILDHVLIYPKANKKKLAYTVANPIIKGKNDNIRITGILSLYWPPNIMSLI